MACITERINTMRIIELTKETKKDLLNNLLKRSPNNYGQFEATVNEIIENVKANGDKALFEYTAKFDKFNLKADNIRFPCKNHLLACLFSVIPAKPGHFVRLEAGDTDIGGDDFMSSLLFGG